MLCDVDVLQYANRQGIRRETDHVFAFFNQCEWSARLDELCGSCEQVYAEDVEGGQKLVFRLYQQHGVSDLDRGGESHAGFYQVLHDLASHGSLDGSSAASSHAVAQDDNHAAYAVIKICIIVATQHAVFADVLGYSNLHVESWLFYELYLASVKSGGNSGIAEIFLANPR